MVVTIRKLIVFGITSTVSVILAQLLSVLDGILWASKPYVLFFRLLQLCPRVQGFASVGEKCTPNPLPFLST